MFSTTTTAGTIIITAMLWGAFGCGDDVLLSSQSDEPPRRTMDAPPPVDMSFSEPYELQEGTYVVSVVGYDFNDCNADFEYYDGRRWPITVVDNTFVVAGSDSGGTFVENVISGTSNEVIDWRSFGWDCVQRYDYLYSGSLHSDTSFTWTWEGNWSAVSGEECSQNENHAEMPCSYRIHFDLELVQE